MYRNVSNCSQEKKCIKINKVFSRCNVKITKEDFFKSLQNGFFFETFWPNKKVTKYLECKDNTV